MAIIFAVIIVILFFRFFKWASNKLSNDSENKPDPPAAPYSANRRETNPPYDMKQWVMDNFENQCMAEFYQLKKNGTTEELVDLWLSKYEDYKAWRWVNPRAKPHDYFYRPGAPDTKRCLELLASANEAYKLAKSKGREEDFFKLFRE